MTSVRWLRVVGPTEGNRAIARILFAVDRSTYCQLAAAEVAAMAAQLGAQVLLLHVAEVPAGVDGSSYHIPEESSELLASFQARLQGPALTTVPLQVRAARVGPVR